MCYPHGKEAESDVPELKPLMGSPGWVGEWVEVRTLQGGGVLAQAPPSTSSLRQANLGYQVGTVLYSGMLIFLDSKLSTEFTQKLVCCLHLMKSGWSLACIKAK